jgi:hypothetical protein
MADGISFPNHSKRQISLDQWDPRVRAVYMVCGLRGSSVGLGTALQAE